MGRNPQYKSLWFIGNINKRIKIKENVMNYLLKRTVTINECPWLERNFNAGEKVYEYKGHTYGVISPDGIACTETIDDTPFFELPKDALVKA
jgi:hypothetical protein